MPARLATSQADFEDRFKELLQAKREASHDVGQTVCAILEDVRRRGDAALFDYTQKFDRLDMSQTGLAIGPDEVAEAVNRADRKAVDALRFARDRIESHHARHLPKDDFYTDDSGVQLGQKWRPVEAAGIYVPGGTASYPSSVLMNAMPARVAGVERIAMVVPTPDGKLNPLVLAAAHLAGVSEIYRIGGAQAVAALAYGTETIKPVVKIVGPGNAWVAAAKREVYGTVGIDMIAGPSEVLVIADKQNNPEWIAIDLLAQAEHDVSAQSILITDDEDFAGQVEQAVQRLLETLPRADIAGKSWADFGAIIVVGSLAEAPALANRLAAEHLEIATESPEELAAQIYSAGALFLGRFTPEAIGDYVAGTNHVLPTARSARFASGLGVLDFMKRTSVLKCDRQGLQAIGPAAVVLGKAEGLDAHALSVSKRLEEDS